MSSAGAPTLAKASLSDLKMMLSSVRGGVSFRDWMITADTQQVFKDTADKMHSECLHLCSSLPRFFQFFRDKTVRVILKGYLSSFEVWLYEGLLHSLSVTLCRWRSVPPLLEEGGEKLLQLKSALYCSRQGQQKNSF